MDFRCKTGLKNIDTDEIKECFETKHTAMKTVLKSANDCLFSPKLQACKADEKPRIRRQFGPLPLLGLGPAPFGSIPSNPVDLDVLQPFHSCMIKCMFENRRKGPALPLLPSEVPGEESSGEGEAVEPPSITLKIDEEMQHSGLTSGTEEGGEHQTSPDAEKNGLPASLPMVNGVDHSVSPLDTEEKIEEKVHRTLPALANGQPPARFRRQENPQTRPMEPPPAPIPFGDIHECMIQLK